MKLLSQKHIEKIDVTNIFLKENLKININQFICKYYSKNPLKSVFERIVKNDFDQETIDFLKEKLGNMNRFRDQRTSEEYGCDLLLGWIVEDATIYLLEELGYNSEIVSLDKQREFLKRPSAKIDICINIQDGKEALIELVADNTGFWKKNSKIHLREQKYEKLKKQNGILLGLDFLNNDFFIKKIEKMKVNQKIERHFLFGGKPATELSFENVCFVGFDKMKEGLEDFFKNF